MRILVADDDADIRTLLARRLTDWGHEPVLAEDGEQAWALVMDQGIQMVITDWIMPIVDGLELCRRIRSVPLEHYVYVLMLTARDRKADLIQGLDAGADDFLTKPFNRDELRVRLKAGERILRLEHDLAERNEKLSRAYEVIENDLEAAAQIQASLLPPNHSTLGDLDFHWIFMPSAFVAGDTLDYFALGPDHVGFYLLDVAGHGVPSAMLSVTLSRFLSPVTRLGRPFLTCLEEGGAQGQQTPSPARTVLDLNERFQATGDTVQYFTMVHGLLETRTGRGLLCQAGHPHPLLVPKDGPIQTLGRGGFPVGMLPQADYEDVAFTLGPGDRLFLYSDGVTEGADAHGREFSSERLMNILQESRDRKAQDLVSFIETALREHNGQAGFKDDVTLLCLERRERVT